MQPESAKREHLSGTLERIVFQNNDNQYCVLRVTSEHHDGIQTVVGYMHGLQEGCHLSCYGKWVNNKQYGQQFQAELIQLDIPHSTTGIIKYLGSSSVKGIGTHFAEKIVAHFGTKTIDIIDHEPERLSEIEGIGKKRIEQIAQNWKEHRAIHSIMLYLAQHGMGHARANRIFRYYGHDAIQVIEKNPYQLYHDIHGIGFKSTDDLAQKIGISKTSPFRIEAGLYYVLGEASGQGHCAMTREECLKQCSKILDIEPEKIDPVIDYCTQEKTLKAHIVDEKTYLLTPELDKAEEDVTKHIKRLISKSWKALDHDSDTIIKSIEFKLNMSFSFSQKEAIKMATEQKMSIITGGPGVGKTTLIRALVSIIEQYSGSLQLCAPTGRAAKRLSESTQRPASTIHRLLGIDPDTKSFKHDASNPLKLSYLIIDEASMIDIKLAQHLLAALPNHAGVLWVGDIDQLPSVGPGNLLSDLIHSECIATTRLTAIFRQAASSQIITNAHRVNDGKMPIEQQKPTSDFFIRYCSDPDVIQNQVKTMISHRIPKHFNLDPIRDIQCLTPMHRGPLGTQALNQLLQKELNPQSQYLEKYGSSFAIGDKIIQLKNNYDKEVFNGDIGFIQSICTQSQTVTIDFDDNIVTYSYEELDEIQLAYATSIHKSQGSEYPVVIMPVTLAHFMLLDKNLIYTGMTRGKELVVLVAEKKALAIAVHQNRSHERGTLLCHRLKSCIQPSNHVNY